jgi:tetraacyldisaccharide 4'-kinase
LLDDGYGKHAIDKLDLIIDVETPNAFCLPSGAYRERLWSDKSAVMIVEGKTFKRSVTLRNPTAKMVLVTAIARPERLDPYLPDVVEKVYFEDHHFYTQGELELIIERSGATSLLVTTKDLVKMSSFNLNLSCLELSVELDEALITTVKEYTDAKKD